MKNKFFIAIFYIIFLFNSNLLSNEQNKTLKVGLLAPLSGPYSEIGNSLLYSLQLALEEINDKNVLIIPRDSGYNDKEKLASAVNEIRSSGAKIIIGPTTHDEFNDVKRYNDLIFISPSNIKPEFSNNIISIGVSLESQLIALTRFINSQKKNKTIIMYPKNEYLDLIEKKIQNLNLKNVKTFTYSPNLKYLLVKLKFPNYSQEKKFRIEKKMFEDKEDEQSIKLERLEQLYTLGSVNFDSVIIIDFGNNLKSVLTSAFIQTLVKKTYCLQLSINGLMKVYFMKIL